MQFLTHVIASGDTLQAISQYYLEDASRWKEIALLNDLDYPFIVESKEQKVSSSIKIPGEKLLIPVENVTNTAVFTTTETEDLYEKSLGEDLDLFSEANTVELTRNGEGQLTSNVYGDLKTTKGIENLKQSIFIRFSIPYGSLYYNPEFGNRFNEFVGEKGTYEGIQKIKIEAIRTALTDPRVADVDVKAVFTEKGALELTIFVTPVGMEQAFTMQYSL